MEPDNPAMAFHGGELAVQAREGTTHVAARLAAGFSASFSAPARAFLERQRLLVLAGTEPGTARVWASLLTGPAGFVATPDEHTLHVRAAAVAGDPLASLWRERGAVVGALAIEFETRRRLKLKGRVEPRADGFALRAWRVFGLCPKYIHAREALPDGAAAPSARRAATLSAAQRRVLDVADTFFIASATPDGGPDVSHRGGRPGFVRTLSERQIEFADYAGNDMFNTLGNLELQPEAGLLFVDFERGATLQVTGTASGTWAPGDLARFHGARRVVAFDVQDVLETSNAAAQRWRLTEYSPYAPD